jgi:hypothetical protein
MSTDLKPIRTQADYEKALARLEELWGSESGTAEGDQLDVLATLIDAYEEEHDPIDPPDPIEAIKFRMEAGPDPAGPGIVDRHANARCGGAEPQAQPVHQHDPAPS